MKIRTITTLSVFFIASSFSSIGQKRFFTKNSTISFYSKTTVQNIEAINKKALVVIDLATNKIEFSVLIKGFEFEKALMQEHFNEDYLESDKYPKAIFKGSFDRQVADLNLSENKTITVNVTGNLILHGVTQTINTVALLQLKNNAISATSSFKILLSDYKVKVPNVVGNNISKEIEIKVNTGALQQLK
ncbi:MAG: YceI family protein [Ferruginibacter sp.]